MVSAAVQHQLTAVVCMLHSDTLTVKKAKEEFGDILDPDQSLIVQVKTQLVRFYNRGPAHDVMNM